MAKEKLDSSHPGVLSGHIDAGTPIQHVRHAQQPTKRNGLQFASVAASVRQSKDSRGYVRKPYAWAAPIRV